MAYLLDDDRAKEKLPIESVQAPIFDSKGIARYALTIGNVDLELDPETVMRFGLEVRRAADEVTAALAVHFGQSQMRS